MRSLKWVPRSAQVVERGGQMGKLGASGGLSHGVAPQRERIARDGDGSRLEVSAVPWLQGVYTCRDMTLNGTQTKLLVSGLLAFGLSLLLGGCDSTYHAYKVAGGSMLPLLHPGDRIFVDESDHARSDLHDGDVIVFRRDNTVLLKRIMAIPGEIIRGSDRKIFRNGVQVDEPYLAPPTNAAAPWLVTFAARTVGPGELFVMGDNRDNSLDSRYQKYGPVRFSDVVGKYKWTYWHASSAAK